MDVGKSFSFVFEDDQWITKILLGAAILLLGILFSWLLLIPLILAFALLTGYGVEITRRVMHGQLSGLPEWDKWTVMAADGIKAIIIGIVYALPMIVLSICVSIPIGIFAENAEGLSTFFSVILSCISLLYAIAMSIVLPAAIAFYVAHDDLRDAFRFGEVLAFVRNALSTYLITFLMSWVAQFVGQLGSIICGVGWLATVPYAYMVTGHLYGQAYLEGKGQIAQPAVEEEIA